MLKQRVTWPQVSSTVLHGNNSRCWGCITAQHRCSFKFEHKSRRFCLFSARKINFRESYSVSAITVGGEQKIIKKLLGLFVSYYFTSPLVVLLKNLMFWVTKVNVNQRKRLRNMVERLSIVCNIYSKTKFYGNYCFAIPPKTKITQSKRVSTDHGIIYLSLQQRNEKFFFDWTATTMDITGSNVRPPCVVQFNDVN